MTRGRSWRAVVQRSLVRTALPLLVAAPEVARACSVCTAGRDDETRFAFLLTTVFLSALPLALIGGVAWWLRRRVRAADDAASVPEGRPDSTPAHGWSVAPDGR